MRMSGECVYNELSDDFGEWEHCETHDHTFPCEGDRRERHLMRTSDEQARTLMPGSLVMISANTRNMRSAIQRASSAAELLGQQLIHIPSEAVTLTDI